MSNLADFAFGTMSMKRLKGKFRLGSTASLPAAITLVSFNISYFSYFHQFIILNTMYFEANFEAL